MKLTLFTLFSNHHSGGTDTSVHPTVASLNAELEGIINDRITLLNGDINAAEEATIGHLRDLLERGEVQEAFTLYCDGEPEWETLKPSDDHYHVEQHDVEWPVIERINTAAGEPLEFPAGTRLVEIIADGLDALTDGRGWDRFHQRANDLADASPVLLDLVQRARAIIQESEDADEHGEWLASAKPFNDFRLPSAK